MAITLPGQSLTGTDMSETFESLCMRCGWKRTVQRASIYEYLAGNSSHPAAEEVWNAVRRKLPALSLESVYRILNDFAAAGVVKRLESYDAVHFDPDVRRHDHFYCRSCGRILDLPMTQEHVFPELAEEYGTVEDMEIRLSGTCRDCLRGGEKTASAGKKRKEAKAVRERSRP